MRNGNFTVWYTGQLEESRPSKGALSGSGSTPPRGQRPVAKVEKAMGSKSPWSGSSHSGRSSNIPYRGRGMTSSTPVQCYFCGKFGHIMARCYARRDVQQLSPATRGRTRDNK